MVTENKQKHPQKPCVQPTAHQTSRHYHGDFEGSGLFTDACPEAAGIRDVYSAWVALGRGVGVLLGCR